MTIRGASAGRAFLLWLLMAACGGARESERAVDSLLDHYAAGLRFDDSLDAVRRKVAVLTFESYYGYRAALRDTIAGFGGLLINADVGETEGPPSNFRIRTVLLYSDSLAADSAAADARRRISAAMADPAKAGCSGSDATRREHVLSWTSKGHLIVLFAPTRSPGGQGPPAGVTRLLIAAKRNSLNDLTTNYRDGTCGG